MKCIKIYTESPSARGLRHFLGRTMVDVVTFEVEAAVQ